MRIISKYSDYYDSASGMGVDMSTVLVRKPKGVPFNNKDVFSTKEIEFLQNVLSYKTSDTKYSYKGNILFFCGRFYPFIIKDGVSLGGKEEYIFSKERIKEIFNKNGEAFWRPNYTHFEYFFNLKDINPFLYFKVPYFIITGMKNDYFHGKGIKSHVEIFPILRDLQFYKEKDPFTAFQEISMFINNELANSMNKETCEISDKCRMEAKGFDNKSFKKPKGSKRGKPRWR